MSKFGDRLRARRLALRLRQTDFLERGVTQSQLSLIENGDLKPSPAKIDSIAAILNVGAIDLVADTELEDVYFAARLTPDEIMVVVESASLNRSERFVGAQESYRRIQLLCEFSYAARVIRPVSIDDESQYQHAARIFRRALDAAREFDAALAGRMFVPDSLIGDAGAPMVQVPILFRRSAAYLRSLVLEYPEADEDRRREQICEQIGLARIDHYLRARSIDISANEAV